MQHSAAVQRYSIYVDLYDFKLTDTYTDTNTLQTEELSEKGPHTRTFSPPRGFGNSFFFRGQF